MAHLFRDLSVKSLYADQKYAGGRDKWNHQIRLSTTLYVGNLSFYTTEEQLHELFAKCGPLKRIVMGIDKFKKTPCGFCFVEYEYRNDTEDAMKYLNGLKLDERIVRVDWDAGFEEGRQYGRGRSGGQVRDEYRADFDAGRGGWGRGAAEQLHGPIGGKHQHKPRAASPAAGPPPVATADVEASAESVGAKRQRAGDGDGASTSNPRFRERPEEESDDDE